MQAALRRTLAPALRGLQAAVAPPATVGATRVLTSSAVLAAEVEPVVKGPKLMDVSIYRWNPEDGAKPRMDTYQARKPASHRNPPRTTRTFPAKPSRGGGGGEISQTTANVMQ
jgi:hypothetical protein